MPFVIFCLFILVMGLFGIQNSVRKNKRLAHQAKENDLVESFLANVGIAQEADSIYIFIRFYDDAIKDLIKLDEMGANPEALTYPTTLLIQKMNDEFQWHLCDAVVRTKEKALSEITEKYKNAKEFQRKCAYSFYDSIRHAIDRFSKDSLELADESLREVFRVAKTDYYGSIIEKNENYKDRGGKFEDPVESEFGKVDSMDGHKFEYWCADLLKKIGFSDVKVTQGSGDQGVDVIAVKDGVCYAIQCKCYSSDLSNKPVQEVHTGKSIYKCQVGVVMTNRHFTIGAKEAADATGVLLWDREKLREMIEQAFFSA